MIDYRIEPGNIPGFNTFVSESGDFPLAISFPKRVTATPVPFAPAHTLCMKFTQPNAVSSLAITRWVLERDDNYILFNDFLDGKADLVWLARREMDDGKGRPFYHWEGYEFADWTSGIFSKPKAIDISPALRGVVRVTYPKKSMQRRGQRIFCQRPRDPRNIIWIILLEPAAEVNDGEFQQMLLSLRWL